MVFRTPSGVLPVLQGVRLYLCPGETLALVGPSGCGKTTLGLSVLGLIRPPGSIRKGTVRFQGTDLGALSRRQWRHLRGQQIAIIFQEPLLALNPLLSIGAQLTEGLCHHRGLSRKPARSLACDLLREVGLAEASFVMESYPHQLSGGQRQRALIAMALLCRPRLLVADEPTSALDVTLQARILELLDRLKRAWDLSVLFITHDLGLVAEAADRIAVMQEGRIVEDAPRVRVLARPEHPYTRELLLSAAAFYDLSRPEAAP